MSDSETEAFNGEGCSDVRISSGLSMVEEGNACDVHENAGWMRTEYQTCCHPERVHSIVGTFSDEQRAAAVEMGFGLLLDISCGRLHHNLMLCILNNFHTRRRTLRVFGHEISITPEDVTEVLGIADGSETMANRASYVDVTEVRNKFRRTKHGILRKEVERVVKSDRLGGETFKQAFILFLITALLGPTSSAYVPLISLPTAAHPSTIRSLNWASWCLDTLVAGISNWKFQSVAYCSGCLVFLQLFYLKNHPQAGEMVNPLEPTIRSWTSSRCMSFVTRLELNPTQRRGAIASGKETVNYAAQKVDEDAPWNQLLQKLDSIDRRLDTVEEHVRSLGARFEGCPKCMSSAEIIRQYAELSSDILSKYAELLRQRSGYNHPQFGPRQEGPSLDLLEGAHSTVGHPESEVVHPQKNIDLNQWWPFGLQSEKLLTEHNLAHAQPFGYNGIGLVGPFATFGYPVGTAFHGRDVHTSAEGFPGSDPFTEHMPVDRASRFVHSANGLGLGPQFNNCFFPDNICAVTASFMPGSLHHLDLFDISKNLQGEEQMGSHVRLFPWAAADSTSVHTPQRASNHGKQKASTPSAKQDRRRKSKSRIPESHRAGKFILLREVTILERQLVEYVFDRSLGLK